ncbi:hypothetical protein CDL60_13470 [Roseateles noduli]|nr:hypothetical protein CDL60_13470 [Roseateles noduli]
MLPIPHSPASHSWLGDAWGPGAAGGADCAITPEMAMHEAAFWKGCWQSLDWVCTELKPLYSEPVRVALRGWSARLQVQATQLGERAQAGELTGFHQQIDRFKRIQSANTGWLSNLTVKEPPGVQRAGAEFLLNRNQFFKRCDGGAFDHLVRAPQADRDRFKQLIDALEICTDAMAGVQCLRQLDTFALKVSPTPPPRF